MRRFRQPLTVSPTAPLDREQLRALVADVLSAGHFYAAPLTPTPLPRGERGNDIASPLPRGERGNDIASPLPSGERGRGEGGVGLEWQHSAARETPWEIFRGRLLDPAHTRLKRAFETWDIFRTAGDSRSAEPLLSLLLDEEGRELHLVRGLLCYVWEGYDAGGNVILSRETTRWVRELTGTIQLIDFDNVEELRDELIGRLFRAVVGASRLPLTSVEAPLPAFSFGELAYFYRPGLPWRQVQSAGYKPAATWAELLERTRGAGLNRSEQAKLLETLLHATPFAEMPALVEALSNSDLPPLLPVLRTLFNEASLSPYTDLVDKGLSLVDALERHGYATPADAVDFLGGLIRQLGRHLTAYDLVTFHHRGANYPDALLLDAALKGYLRRIEEHPELFSGPEDERRRLRRRALRQGWLLRRFYEGHPVPDAPASPGESMRVLPPPHPRVSEEQILHPGKRTRRLFADGPLTAHLGKQSEEVLRRSMADLRHPEELREMGLALFLDRPLGVGKAPGEPDQTILLSHLAFSPSLARQRLKWLGATAYEGGLQELVRGLRGVPVSAVGGRPRPGAVSAADARQVADDFLFLRTTAQTAAAFCEQYGLGGVVPVGPLLILPAADPGKGERLVIYDGEMRPRLQLIADVSQGYATRAGDEYLRGGLRVVRMQPETDR